MRTKYKFIEFTCSENHDITGRDSWWIFNRKAQDLLGYVEYYPSWRQYVFVPEKEVECIFNVSCLEDIIHFIGQLKENWQHKNKKERVKK